MSLTLKIARTVTGSVAEISAPNVRHTKNGMAYVQPRYPNVHLVPNGPQGKLQYDLLN